MSDMLHTRQRTRSSGLLLVATVAALAVMTAVMMHKFTGNVSAAAISLLQLSSR